jgi:thiamine-phosphate pyrophosphorylase
MGRKLRGLYAITPDHTDGTRLLIEVEAALAGGCRMLQYRDKTSAMPECVARARALRELTCRYGAKLLINDDLALAVLVEADGVHLGKDDGNLMAARALLGASRILGASCYADFAAARAADAAGADYVAFGAVHPSPTKPNATRAAADLFSRASVLNASSCAIGGITLNNAPALIAAGADLLAVITDLFSAPDITARAAAYQRLFEEHSA